VPLKITQTTKLISANIQVWIAFIESFSPGPSGLGYNQAGLDMDLMPVNLRKLKIFAGFSAVMQKGKNEYKKICVALSGS